MTYIMVDVEADGPIPDARGNAEALLKMKEMGLRIKL